MNLKASFFYAKSLISPKTEKKSSARKSFLGAIFCIGLSLIPLIVVINVTDGMIDGMTQRLIGLSSGHVEAFISPYFEGVSTASHFEKTASEVSKIKGVKNCYPEVSLSALATANEYKTGAQIRAVTKNIFTENQDFETLFEFVQGSANDFGKEKNAIIGKQISELLSVNVGDSIKIITTRTVAGKTVPKLTTFNICGIVTSGYQELDALWVFVTLEDAYKNLPVISSKIITKTDDDGNVKKYKSIESNASFLLMANSTDAFSPELSEVQKDIQNYFGEYANVYRWNQVHESKFQNFSSTKVMLVFIMILIVLVASINISSAIIMIVMERQKEIAILKSFGASSTTVTFAFLICGISCSVGGILIGVPLGCIISVFFNQIIFAMEYLLNFVSHIFSDTNIQLLNPEFYLQNVKVTISSGTVILVCFGTMILSLLVSIIPSIKAGKEKPLDTLRKN